MTINRIRECSEYIARWDLGEPVQSVQMHGSDMLTEQCIQALVVELLRDFVENPFPEGLMEGTATFNMYIDQALRKALTGTSFSLTQEEEDAVKNLAWNYYIEGISKVHSKRELKGRLIKISRHWPAGGTVQ